MKLSLPKILCALVLLLGAESQAQLKTASVVANCRSIALDKVTGFDPDIGPVEIFFTTYDGGSGFPIHQDLGNGYWLFGQELRPRAGQPGVYEADYVIFDSSFVVQYGWLRFNLPTTDSDGNGLPDISQKDKAVNTAVSGSGASDSPAVASFDITGNFSRNANSQVGNYSITVNNAGGSVGYSGRWVLLNLFGSISYQRGSQNTLNFNLTSTNSVGNSVGFTGSTTFNVTSANQIAVPQFSLTGTDNKTYTIYAAVLNRSGNRYSGDWKFLDGNFLTSWSDYTSLAAEIIDTNDSDGDGIPDLSDTLPVAPSIVSQPQSRTVGIGANVTFSVAATGTPTPSYQWKFNGTNIAGATFTTYTRNSVQPSDAGSYTVVASNIAGSTNSQAATLTVQYTPIITLQPKSKAVTAGYVATFSVAANAVPSPGFQWYFNDSPIPGATSFIYSITNSQPANSGNYSAVVSNSFGSVPSATAVLTVGFPYTFTTLAGLALNRGSTDATGIAARFSDPSGVAVDSAGNVYVADSGNHSIRKVTSAGVVTTLAGLAGFPGTNNGTGIAARFYSPFGVAMDSDGNVYVADTRNHTIRKLAPTGVVTTLAGLAGSSGSADGTGIAAQFNSPYGVAADSAGNIYVADTGNSTIRKVTSAGVVTTLAGLAGSSGSADGTSAARFASPTGVAVDSAGNVYVADGSHTIRKVTPAGVVTTLAGLAVNPGSGDGTGSAARFNYPYGVTVDSAENVYVSDRDNNTIRKVTPTGVVTTLAGLALIPGSADGTGIAARFNSPFGVAADTAGNVYVGEIYNHTIRKGYLERAVIVTSGPGFGFNGGQFGFILTGPMGQLVVVEASTDLVSWLPFWTNTFSGSLNFSDPQSGVYSNRFYRARTP